MVLLSLYSCNVQEFNKALIYTRNIWVSVFEFQCCCTRHFVFNHVLSVLQLFSSGIYCQNSPEFDDLFGFSVEDVMKEVKRGGKLVKITDNFISH